MRRLLILSLTLLQAPSAGWAQPALPALHAALQASVDAKTIPGAIVLVSKGGRMVSLDAVGVAGAGATAPMHADTIFWFASMSKPIAATALLMLVDEGKVGLDDPLSKYIPEFSAAMQVKVLKPGSPPPPPPGPPGAAPAGPPPEYDLVPAARSILVRDLLTHTSGLPSGVGGPGIPAIEATDTLATWAPKIAKTSLEAQPGAKWIYNNAIAIDLVSRVVEVASGQTYDQFLKSRIFLPLDMKDTGFRKLDLESRGVGVDRFMATNPRALANPAIAGAVYTSGAAGLWGTVEDYSRFAEMLDNGGQYHGHRLLKPGTAAMMHTDQVHGLYHGNGKTAKAGMVFGLTMEVVEDSAAAGSSAPNGSFGWEGGGGTHFWVTPTSQTVVVMYAPNLPLQDDIERIATSQP